jgi:release factor glutamine methyltransferase
LIENIKLDENAETLIIANLPYIPTDQYFKLDRSVKDFEPKEALDGGEDGIKYYIELITQIKEKGIKGLGIFEIEPSTLSEFKRFNPAVKKDLYGRDRFVLIRFC